MQKSGKRSIKEIIEAGIKWREEMKKKGWQETPDGLLPMVEVKRAGFLLNKNGAWTIPAEEYIADGNYDRKAGEKYWGPSRQYLNWKKNRKKSPETKTIKQFNFKNGNDTEVAPVFKNDGEIDVSQIPF